MANPKKIKKTTGEKRPRRGQNIDLTDEQLQSLIGLWRGYHGGTKAFAEVMAQKEDPNGKPSKTAIAAKMKALYRIEDRTTGVSHAAFKTVANVLGITSEELKGKISALNPGNAISTLAGPWITDEKALAEYRRVYYGYYYTKQGDDYFWMHHRIDFSKPYKGCLHTTMNYGIDRPIYYKVYGYLFQEMLVAITQSDEERNQLESVAIYHDFRRPIREHLGHFAIRVNEDWNGYFGAGGSIMLREPIPGTENEGRQSPAMCVKLTEYWKQLGGERCDRLLSLFGHGPFSQAASEKQEKGAAAPKKRPKKKSSRSNEGNVAKSG